MTDYQLCIMKTLERQVLVAAIEIARDGLLSSNAERTRQHKAGRFGIPVASCLVSPKFPDDHYEPGEYEALLPFLEILDSLDSQIALLRGKEE